MWMGHEANKRAGDYYIDGLTSIKLPTKIAHFGEMSR